MAPDKFKHTVDERIATQIAQPAQGDAAAEVIVAVGVTPRTPKRTLTCDFDGEERTVPSQQQTPGIEHPREVHWLTHRHRHPIAYRSSGFETHSSQLDRVQRATSETMHYRKRRGDRGSAWRALDYFTLNGSVIVFGLGPLSTAAALATSKARPISLPAESSRMSSASRP